MAIVRRARGTERTGRRLLRMLVALTLLGIAFGTAGWHLPSGAAADAAASAPVSVRVVAAGDPVALSTPVGADDAAAEYPAGTQSTTVDAAPAQPAAASGPPRWADRDQRSGHRAVPAAGAPRAPPTRDA